MMNFVRGETRCKCRNCYRRVTIGYAELTLYLDAKELFEI